MDFFLCGELSRLAFYRSKDGRLFEGSKEKKNSGIELIANLLETNCACSLAPTQIVSLSVDVNGHREDDKIDLFRKVTTTEVSVGSKSKSNNQERIFSYTKGTSREENIEISFKDAREPNLDKSVLVGYFPDETTMGYGENCKARKHVAEWLKQHALGDDGKRFAASIIYVSAEQIKKNKWDKENNLLRLFSECADRSIIVTDIDSIRQAGEYVSKGESWEKTLFTLEGLLRDIDYDANALDRPKGIVKRNDPKRLFHWVQNHFDQVVIDIGMDGAIVRNKDAGNSTYYFHAEDCEGDFANLEDGVVLCEKEIFLASMISSACELVGADGSMRINSYFNDRGYSDAIKKSLVALRRHFVAGYKTEKETPVGVDQMAVFDPKYHLIKAISEVQLSSIIDMNLNGVKGHLIEGDGRKKYGSFLEEIDDGELMKRIAISYVKTGQLVLPDEVNEKFEVFEGGICKAKIGHLETIDRFEAQSLRTAKNQISAYLEKSEEKRPLSIAVFGPPGCGKSFSVEQIVEDLRQKFGNLLADKFITINISQLREPEELTVAMNAIRNQVIAGHVPFVFFDEFDSGVGTDRLFWLKHFLAPMQDGNFRDHGTNHDIGKSVFIFAGGTSSNFADFSKGGEVKKKDPPEDSSGGRLTLEQQSSKKLPDFVSRLNGYIDISGPNRIDEKNGRPDTTFKVRRAVLLRSIIQRKAPSLISKKTGLLRMDPKIVEAFITVENYNHGVRSMEALITMSSNPKEGDFVKSCLPTAKLIKLHVDAAIKKPKVESNFMDIVHGKNKTRH